MAEKIPVIYGPENPDTEGVKYIAINIKRTPFYVWTTYYSRETIPNLSSSTLEDILIVSKSQANRLFEFRKAELGEIDDIWR